MFTHKREEMCVCALLGMLRHIHFNGWLMMTQYFPLEICQRTCNHKIQWHQFRVLHACVPIFPSQIPHLLNFKRFYFLVFLDEREREGKISYSFAIIKHSKRKRIKNWRQDKKFIYEMCRSQLSPLTLALRIYRHWRYWITKYGIKWNIKVKSGTHQKWNSFNCKAISRQISTAIISTMYYDRV